VLFFTAETYAEFSSLAADLVCAQVRARPNGVLGLPTGATPEGMYTELVRRVQGGEVDLSGMTTFNLDEYVGLRPHDPQSYHAYMWEHLFRHTPVRARHLPHGDAADPAAEAARYEAAIAGAGGFDLVILGLGHNGHIGFNEPGADFTAGTRVVRLTDQTRQANARYFVSPSAVPAHAITVGIGTICGAKQVLLLASGEAKGAILHRSLAGPVTPDVPATALQGHDHLIVLADRAAARRMVLNS
jgi:glucosamine-6-phosphate deaminase